jgi:TonB family protein
VVQTKVMEAAAPEFGQALAAAVENFTFEPAMKGGRPSKALQAFQQDFDRDDQVVTGDDLRLLRLEQKKPEAIASLKEVDGTLTPTSRRPPRFPLSQIASGLPGDAMIEFLVDEDGRARLPRVISASHEDFGYAAVQSIATWRFEPPKRGGRAVVVRVRVPVKFAPVGAAPEATK